MVIRPRPHNLNHTHTIKGRRIPTYSQKKCGLTSANHQVTPTQDPTLHMLLPPKPRPSSHAPFRLSDSLTRDGAKIRAHIRLVLEGLRELQGLQEPPVTSDP